LLHANLVPFQQPGQRSREHPIPLGVTRGYGAWYLATGSDIGPVDIIDVRQSVQFRASALEQMTEGQAMVVLGYIFLVLLGLVVVGGLVALVASLPDIRRYFALSRM
jgi:hypothetical protein